MFSIVIDGKTEINESFLTHPINDYAGIYVEMNPNNYAWFERFDKTWTWETKDGKYSYNFPDNYLGEDFLDEMTNKLEGKPNDNMFIRVYEKENDLRKTISVSRGRYPFTEFLAHIEMDRLGKENIKAIYADPEIDEDKKEEAILEFADSHNIISEDVEQIIRLLSAQGHNDESLKFTLNAVESIIRGIPLSPVMDNVTTDEYKSEWAEVQSDEKEYEYILNLISKYITDENPIKNIYLNVRANNIIKVHYENNDYKYFNIRTEMYTKNGKEWFISKDDITEVTMPWKFVTPNQNQIDNDADTSDLIPITF